MSVVPPEEYRGTAANGVMTQNWRGPFERAYVFYGAPRVELQPLCGQLGEATELSCHCEAGAGTGSVWGSGPYTADSDICTAARHAGVTTVMGGDVTVRRAPGQPSYVGSQANGITTSDWGSYDTSIMFGSGE